MVPGSNPGNDRFFPTPTASTREDVGTRSKPTNTKSNSIPIVSVINLCCLLCMYNILSIMKRVRVGSTNMQAYFNFNLMYIFIIKGSGLGPQNLIWKPKKDQRELKECVHSQNTKQIAIINLFNELSTVTCDASLGLQICGPNLDSFHNGNVHYKWEVLYVCFPGPA